MRALKTIAYCVSLLLLVAVGWLTRGMLPSGPPAAGMRPGGRGGPGGPPEVVTAKVEEVSLDPPLEYVGHVEAIQEADLYAQVQGTIQAVHFDEGGMVKKGDLLFTIDPERYEAQVAVSEASVAQALSNLTGAKADLEAAEANLNSARAGQEYADQDQKRQQRLASADMRIVVQADADKAESDAQRARASVQVAKAQIGQKRAQIQQFEAQVRQTEADLKLAKINLEYTQVRSPIDGRIGRAEVTAGDYVSPGNGLLARVVQVSPVRVQFAISDRDYLNLVKENTQAGLAGVITRLQLSNGDAFPEVGKVDFVSNLMDPGTATIAVRLRFDNGAGLLVPNSFVTVLMDQAKSRHSLAVPQEAVMTDQNGEYVYVVNSAGVVERRALKLGDQVGGDRIVDSGLKAGEMVIIQGLQKVQPGRPVKIAQTGDSPRPEGA